MTTIKVIPSAFLSITSMQVFGIPEDVMDETARFLEEFGGVLIKQKPFAIRARVVSKEYVTVVKCRLYLVGGKVFLEMARRRGDVVLFVSIWRALKAALHKFSTPDEEASASVEIPENTVVVAA